MGKIFSGEGLKKKFLYVWSQDTVSMNSITVAVTTDGGFIKNVQVSKIPSNVPQFDFYLHVFLFYFSILIYFSGQTKNQILHRAVCMFQS